MTSITLDVVFVVLESVPCWKLGTIGTAAAGAAKSNNSRIFT